MNRSGEALDKNPLGRCLLDNWVEERASALLDKTNDRAQIHRHGHKGILSADMAAKAQDITTMKAEFTHPTGLRVRQRGIRGELFEKHLYRTIREQVLKEQSPPVPSAELVSTTKDDFGAEGFKPTFPDPSWEHNYRSEQAITFWSENHKKIQGVTPVRSKDTPFKKNCNFSTPISACLDDDEKNHHL
ncbi:sperm-associated antigen 8 [Paramormyrops kingsleyae]|uniref:Sperm associated antigen 8 n=1 Tax=Paramormyrops kingsleyae TaxID=1676925 RepID=A0A3B3QX90_9TELE|nr:sperm-associated antigen 8 [Paramormyrops kingsleyae]